MFDVILIPIAAFPGLFFCPESPRWLIAQDRSDEDRAVFAKYHASGDEKATSPTTIRFLFVRRFLHAVGVEGKKINAPSRDARIGLESIKCAGRLCLLLYYACTYPDSASMRGSVGDPNGRPMSTASDNTAIMISQDDLRVTLNRAIAFLVAFKIWLLRVECDGPRV
jgi:hypothetical protein